MPTAAEAKIRISAVDKTKQAFNSVDKGLKGIGKSAASLKGALGALAGGAIFRGLDQFGKAALQANIQFENFARRLGASAGGLSELAVAGDLAGVAFSQVAMAVQRSTRRIGEAAQGYGEARDAIKKLGLEARDLANLRSDEQFNALADSLLNVENRTERLTLAFKLFDSEGTAVVQMLDDLQRAKELARDSGAVITQREVDNMLAFREQVAETDAAWRSLQQAFISTGIPRTLENIKQGGIVMAEAIVDAFSVAGKSIGAFAAAAAAVLQGEFRRALDILAEFKADVSDLFGDQEGAAGGVAAAFAGSAPDDGKGFNDVIKKMLEKQAKELAKRNARIKEIRGSLIDQLTVIRAQAEGWGETAERVKKLKDIARQVGIEYKDLPEDLKRILEETDKWKKKLEEVEERNRLIESAAKRMAENIQDSLAEFIFDPFDKGLKGMFDGMVNTLRKMAAEVAAQQIFKSILGDGTTGGGLLNSALGFIGIGARALGGPVAAGMPYLVGEKGPELFVPNAAGGIVPNDNIGALTVNVNLSGGQTAAARQSAGQIGADIGRAINLAMRRNQ